jgi:RNA polymerase sigma-70 factor (ECF subfamily)
MTEQAKSREAGGDEDLELIRQVLAGDRRAFETLVRRHERRVFRVALAILENTEEAEEAMQDAFLKAYRHLSTFRGDSKFTTWLTRIAVNQSLERRRSTKVFVPLDESREHEAQQLPSRFEPWMADPEKTFGKQEIRRLVEEAIQALPTIYREAIVLRDIEEMSAEEAAEALGISLPALKSRLLRARLSLRESLGHHFERPRPLPTRMLDSAKQMGNMMKAALARPGGR